MNACLIAGDQVPVRRCHPSHNVIGRVDEVNAGQPIALAPGPARRGSDKVPNNGVTATTIQFDAMQTKAINDQPANGAQATGDGGMI